MKTINEKLLNYALESLEKGISVIPVAKNKIPLISWKQFQDRFATTTEVRSWFDSFEDPQIGFVTGKISNLLVIDIEKGGDPSFLPQETTIVGTGGGGYHYYFKFEEGIMNKARIRPLVDWRGEGGYVVSPNSVSDKGPYSVLQEAPWLPFPKELFPAKIDIFQTPGVTHSEKVINEYPGYGIGQRNDEMARYIGYVLTMVHPLNWNGEAWDVVQRANERNTPSLPLKELQMTFESIKRLDIQKNPSGRSSGIIRPTAAPSFLNDDSDSIQHLADVAEAQVIDPNDIYPLEMPCFDEAIKGGVCVGDVIVIAGQTGQGKCLGKGTPIVMYDGRIKVVEEVVDGDLLMGPDSLPRRVSGTISGAGELFKIVPTRGETYVANGDHILSLKRTQTQLLKNKKPAVLHKDEIVNISVNEYQQQSEYFKHIHKGWQIGVDWKKISKKNILNPYFLGVWLGDGTSVKTQITSMDTEVSDYCSNYAKNLGLKISKYEQKNNRSSLFDFVTDRTGGKKNILREDLRQLGVWGKKHIPLCYLTDTKENRLLLLAGLIDTDGYTNTNCYVFVNKNERLAKETAFLARSLGLHATCNSFINKKYQTTYWKVGISGECSIIPIKIKRKKVVKRKQKKNVLRTAISISSIGKGRYYGFELDGDGLFLLGDFTVTHNTTLAQDWTMSLIKGKRKAKALWFSYEVLATHLWEKFQEMGMAREDCVFIPAKHSTGNVEWVEKKIQEGKAKFGIKAVFIDHLGFLLPKTDGTLGKNLSSNYAAFLTQVMRDLKTIALKEEVIIFLPVHMKKVDSHTKYSDINDIKDSSGVGQESDLVFLIERERNKDKKARTYFTDRTKITLAKNRKTGITIVGDFTMVNGRFAYDNREARADAVYDSFGEAKVPSPSPSPEPEPVFVPRPVAHSEAEMEAAADSSTWPF